MAEQVSCLAFPCQNCGVPILLPLDDFERLVPHQGESTNDDRPVILVCEPCKHSNIYSPVPSSPYFHGMMSTTCFRNGVTGVLYSPKCEGELSEFQAPLVITWIGEPSEEDKQRRYATWIGGHLRCSAGHVIPWPWKQA
jgi:hypothetical protein